MKLCVASLSVCLGVAEDLPKIQQDQTHQDGVAREQKSADVQFWKQPKTQEQTYSYLAQGQRIYQHPSSKPSLCTRQEPRVFSGKEGHLVAT
ncbi:hypothetical protein AV530_011530 [Patagioenas fasciata monilis]|uniref:Uncharacterized protein n=1 Tax=Patagioenas fasciata monilis TaxID=372326 RepID=A0A1V4JVC4_PATFA|nr:hypothetical protein AV530_011530 [Patagioenas fasciata monilis]